MGGEGVGVFGGWGDDTGLCGGVFCLGFGNLCGECGDFWGGDVGACGFSVGGFCLGICEFSPYLLFNLHPFLDP